MISKTLKDYQANYQANLDAFLNDYEDNTKSIFLQNQLEKYNKFLSVLLRHKNTNVIFPSQLLVEYLEDLNPEYNGIDLEKPDNYITSARRIVEFITNEINLLNLESFLPIESHAEKNKFEANIEEKINFIGNTESEHKELDNQNLVKVEDYKIKSVKLAVEDFLEDFKEDINGDGYKQLFNAMVEYFVNGAFPILENKINFKKINKKRVGWALRTLYKSEKNDSLSYDYLLFAKENINLFEKVDLNRENFKTCNLYKYFTTNPDN